MKFPSKLLVLALLVAGLVLANYLASSLPLRFDATAERIYTLSSGTKAILAQIKEPVYLDFYFSRSNEGLDLRIKNYAARVEEMLRQYVRASHGRIRLSVIDPKPDTAEEEKAIAAGLVPQVWPGTGEKFQFGLVAIQADQQKTIPVFSPPREPFLEYDLSQLLYEVQQLDRRRLGLLTSLPLQPSMDVMALQSGRMPQNQFVIGELEKSFEIVPVEPSDESLPEKLDALAVIHPQGLSPKLQFAIDQFLLSGKPVFIAVDPLSHYFKGRGEQMAAMTKSPSPNLSSDLPVLFKGWGIDYNAGEVVGDLESELSARGPSGVSERMPIWLALMGDDLNGQAPPTSQLNSIWLFEAGSFTLHEGAGLTLTPLLQSSARSGVLASTTLGFTQPDDLARQITPTGRKTLAALIQGKFKSAFPNGAPEEKKEAEGEKPEGDGQKTPKSGTAEKNGEAAKASSPASSPGAPLKESLSTSTLLLIADSDWLLDDYSVRRLNFMGVQAAEPLNDNLAFASNALEFLSGSKYLISIRGKGTSVRPFTVVRDMEAEAEMRYKEQLNALDARLGQVQKKLADLQGKKLEGGRLVASPEITQAIEDFRRQQVKLSAERRKIRKALREGIERLENSLLAFNLLASPLLVGAFGWWFYRRRR